MKIAQSRFFLISILIAAIFIPSSLFGLSYKPYNGEHLNYNIKWGPLPAGVARIDFSKNGSTYFIHLQAKTHPYFDLFYPIRLYIESRLTENLEALRFFQDYKEGFRRKKKEKIIFSSEQGTASYYKNGKHKRTIPVPHDIFDPLSILNAFRQFDMDSQEKHIKVTDGKKIIQGNITLLRREKVKTAAGLFDTMVLRSNVKGIGGVFRDDPKATITLWISDDSRRIPVRLASKLKIGSFSAELANFKRN